MGVAKINFFAAAVFRAFLTAENTENQVAALAHSQAIWR
jgi:hypothetical protein